MDFTLSEEHQAFADSVARFAQDKLAAGALERAHSPHYPWETASLLAEQGLLGIAFPEADGGQGGSLMHAVLAIAQLALVCPKGAAVVGDLPHSARERAAGRGWIQEADLGLQRGAPGQCLARAGAGPACLQPGARARTGTPPVRTRAVRVPGPAVEVRRHVDEAGAGPAAALQGRARG